MTATTHLPVHGSAVGAAATWYPGPLRGRLLLHESRNTGAAFSVGTGQPVLNSLIAVAFVAVVVRHVRKVTSSTAAVPWG